MPRGILAGAAMGSVFFVIPAVLASISLGWFVLRLRRPGIPTGVKARVAWSSAREPVQTAAVLTVTGIVLVGFVAGDLGPGTYFDVAMATLAFVGESFVDWEAAGTSESIAVRGFAFIIGASACLVTWVMVRYYAARWAQADHAERRLLLGDS